MGNVLLVFLESSWFCGSTSVNKTAQWHSNSIVSHLSELSQIYILYFQNYH